MIDKFISPEEGGDGKSSSRITSNREGTFKPANVKKPGNEITRPTEGGDSRSFEKMNGATLEQLEKRGRALGKIESMVREIAQLKKSAKGQLQKNLTTLEDEVEDLSKKIIDEGILIDDEVDEFLKESESYLDSLANDIIKNVQEKERRFTSLIVAGRDYDRITLHYADTITKIESSDSSIIPEKDLILFEIADLGWLNDNEEIEKKLDSSGFDTVEVQERINALFRRVSEAEETLQKIEKVELEKKRKEEELLRVGEVEKTTLKSLQAEALSLRVVDTKLHSLREVLDIKIQKVISSFDAKPNDAKLSGLQSAVKEYTELLEKMRLAVITPIAPPEFLAPKKVVDKSTLVNNTPLEIPKDEGAQEVQTNVLPTSPATPITPDTSVVATVPVIPPTQNNEQVQTPTQEDDTTIKGLTGNWQVGYSVNLNGKEEEIKNHRVPGTILRYQDVVQKGKKRGIDFSKAQSLKEATLAALTAGDFTQAGVEARQLGDELNIIIRDKLTIPEIILGTRDRYAHVIKNTAHAGKDFSAATSLDEEVAEAIEEGDIDLADEKARALGKELNVIELPEVKKQPSITQPIKPAPPQSPLQNPVQNPDKKAPVPPQVTNVDASKTQKSSTPESIKFAGTVRRSADGLQIKIGNDFKDIPKAITVALFIFKKSYTDPTNSGKDFSVAQTHKDAILKNVEMGNFDEAVKLVVLLNAELEKINGKENKEKFRNVPLGEIVSILTKSRLTPDQQKKRETTGTDEDTEMLTDLLDWEQKWIKSGKLDAFRESNGNIKISEAQIASTKTLLSTYLQILIEGVDGGMNADLVRSAQQNIIIYVKILAGIHNEAKSDIKYLVEHYSENGDEALFQKLKTSIFEGLDRVTKREAELSRGTSTKGATLRPTVSGTSPSPRLEKYAVEKKFEIQKSVLVSTNETLAKINSYLTSDLEKTAFARLSEELRQLQETIEATPTKKAIDIFEAKVNRFAFELAKKVKFVTAQHGEGVLSTPQPVRAPGTIVMRSKTLRGNAPAKETLEEWTARQAAKGSNRDLEESKKQKAQAELYEKHKEIFKKNPGLYQEVYSQKNSARDALTEDISGRLARDVVIDLTNKRHDAMGKKIKLQEDVMNKIFTGNYEQALLAITQEIAALDADIKKYTTINLAKTAGIPVTASSFVTNKQVYSPARDASLNDKERGIGRNYTLNENYEPVKIDRTTLTDKEIEEIYGRDKDGNLNEKAQLSGSLYPNHTEGMVSSLSQDQADKVLGTYKVKEGAKETAQVLQENRVEEGARALAAQQLQVATPENKQERHNFVSKLADVLFRYPSVKLRPWGWLAAGLSTFALTTTAAYVTANAITANKEGRTLADVIKNQPSWRTFISENIPKAFLVDFNGPKEKSFDELITKHAPSFGISPANPAPKDKIANLLCKNVYDIEGAGQGLTEQQQQECARIVKNLQEVMKATQAPNNVLYDKDVRLFGDLTVREFYEQTRKVAAAADGENDRLRKV